MKRFLKSLVGAFLLQFLGVFMLFGFAAEFTGLVSVSSVLVGLLCMVLAAVVFFRGLYRLFQGRTK